MTSFSTNELITAFVARQIEDDDLVFTGVGTNGRAFTLAVGIPVAATRLAQLRHAPGAVLFWGGLLDPDLANMPRSLLQDDITRWRAAAAPQGTDIKCDMLARSAFDVSFESAAQIDRFGNLNITAIGPHHAPKVRLVGCLAQPEHLAYVRKPIVIVDMKPRTFVAEVDFITSVGHYKGGDSRKQLRLPGGGTHLVITDKAIFDFQSESRTMQLQSLHPGVSLDEVLDIDGLPSRTSGHHPRDRAAIGGRCRGHPLRD